VAHETLALCAGAGLHLVALPTTNLYLQGAWDRTPVQRGITRIREAAARGGRFVDLHLALRPQCAPRAATAPPIGSNGVSCAVGRLATRAAMQALML